MIRRIIFTGDGFRSLEGEAKQRDNVEWLDRHFGPLFRDITALPTSIALPLTSSSVAQWVAFQKGTIGLDGWAEVFWSTPTDKLISSIEESASDALVVSIEMPPVMRKALDAANVAWIDIGISPLRFLPDFVIHVNMSNHFSKNSIQDKSLQDNEINAASRSY